MLSDKSNMGRNTAHLELLGSSTFPPKQQTYLHIVHLFPRCVLKIYLSQRRRRLGLAFLSESAEEEDDDAEVEKEEESDEEPDDGEDDDEVDVPLDESLSGLLREKERRRSFLTSARSLPDLLTIQHVRSTCLVCHPIDKHGRVPPYTKVYVQATCLNLSHA